MVCISGVVQMEDIRCPSSVLKLHTSMCANSINNILPEVNHISMAAAAVTSLLRRKKEANH